MFETQLLPAQFGGLVTTTATLPTAATSAARTAIVTWVAETTVTARAMPPTVAVAPFTKPVPVTVRGKAALPAAMPAGLSEPRFGVGLMVTTLTAGLVAARV